MSIIFGTFLFSAQRGVYNLPSYCRLDGNSVNITLTSYAFRDCVLLKLNAY